MKPFVKTCSRLWKTCGSPRRYPQHFVDVSFVSAYTRERFASKETLVLLVLAKRGSGKPSNVTIRGLPTPGLRLRPQVRVIQGRMFRPGTAEIIAGVKIAQGFAGTGLGERIRLGGREWTVVGLFDARNSGFSSEIWGDVDQLMQAFRRSSTRAPLGRTRP